MNAAEELSFDDAQILRLESDAIKGHTGKVAVVEPAQGAQLDAGELRDRVKERIRSLPRLSQRVSLPRSTRDPATWERVAALDLDWHVSAVQSGGEALTEEGFRALAASLFSERLDHSRPLWRIDVVPLTGGRTGLVARIHHAMADGVTAIRTLSALLWDPDAGKAEVEEGSKARRPPLADSQRHPGRDKPGRLTTLKRLPGALRRELRPGADTALDRHIGPRRELAWRIFPLERLKAIEHHAGEGVTVNDVVLAIVAGALRGWLDSGARPDRLRAQIPVCLHLDPEAPGAVGNRDSFLNVDLPISEPDPPARLRAINRETYERKLDHDAETLYAFFHALGRFRPLHRGITRVTSGPREFALSVSNVPGPRLRPRLLGHDVSEFVSFAEPADRHALRVSVISLGGDLAFGLCADPDAVGNLDRLADALENSLEELDLAVRR